MDYHEHWNQVFTTKAPDAVSWYQADPKLSLRLIEAAGLTSDT